MMYPHYARLSDQLLKRNTDRLIADLRKILAEQPNGIYLKSLGYLAVSQVKFKTDKQAILSYRKDEIFFFIPDDGYTAVTFHTGEKKTKAKSYMFSMSEKLKNEIIKNKTEINYQNHHQLIKQLKITSEPQLYIRRRVNKRN